MKIYEIELNTETDYVTQSELIVLIRNMNEDDKINFLRLLKSSTKKK